MLFIEKATYPAQMIKKARATYLSPKIPKCTSATELASLRYGDDDGYHTVLIIAAANGNIGDFLDAQAERNAYLQSRVRGLKVEVRMGNSVGDAMSVASKYLTR